MAVDRYVQWFSLPPGKRPPDHYTLLGVPQFCIEPKTIEDAAYARLDKLDAFSLSADGEIRSDCQRLMNEVAKARLTLLTPDKRQAYDRMLCEQSDLPYQPALSALPGIPDEATHQPTADSDPAQRPATPPADDDRIPARQAALPPKAEHQQTETSTASADPWRLRFMIVAGLGAATVVVLGVTVAVLLAVLLREPVEPVPKVTVATTPVVSQKEIALEAEVARLGEALAKLSAQAALAEKREAQANATSQELRDTLAALQDKADADAKRIAELEALTAKPEPDPPTAGDAPKGPPPLAKINKFVSRWKQPAIQLDQRPTALAIRDDGKVAAVATAEGTLAFFDPRTSKVIENKRLPDIGEVRDMAFLGDKRDLTVVTTTQAGRLVGKQFEGVVEYPMHAVTDMSINGRFLAVVTPEQLVRVFDLSSGARSADLLPPWRAETQVGETITHLAVSADGTACAAAITRDWESRILLMKPDNPEGKPREFLPVRRTDNKLGRITALEFGPDRWLYFGAAASKGWSNRWAESYDLKTSQFEKFDVPREFRLAGGGRILMDYDTRIDAFQARDMEQQISQHLRNGESVAPKAGDTVIHKHPIKPFPWPKSTPGGLAVYVSFKFRDPDKVFFVETADLNAKLRMDVFGDSEDTPVEVTPVTPEKMQERIAYFTQERINALRTPGREDDYETGVRAYAQAKRYGDAPGVEELRLIAADLLIQGGPGLGVAVEMMPQLIKDDVEEKYPRFQRSLLRRLTQECARGQKAIDAHGEQYVQALMHAASYYEGKGEVAAARGHLKRALEFARKYQYAMVNRVKDQLDRLE